jgi:hypothetical protein
MFFAALAGGLAVQIQARGDVLEKMTIRFTTSDKTEFLGHVKDGTLGNGTSRLETFAVASSFPKAQIEYKVRIKGKESKDWFVMGRTAGEAGAEIEAVNFRLTGEEAGGYRLGITVLTAAHVAPFEQNTWAGFKGEPITGVVLTMAPHAKLEKLRSLDDDVRRARMADEVTEVAVAREREKRSVLPDLMGSVGFSVGMCYGGPAGAVGGAILGYALGHAVEKTLDRAIAYTKDVRWGERVEVYFIKIRKGRDDAVGKPLDWFAKVDPVKIASKGFKDTPLDPRTWNPARW